MRLITASETSFLIGIFGHYGPRSIPNTDSKRDLEFGNTLVRSRGMVELMIQTSGSTLDIPVVCGVAHVETPALQGYDVLYGNNFLFEKLTNHLWSTYLSIRFRSELKTCGR